MLGRQFREPLPLTGVLVVLLLVILLWHDSIARAIGTEAPAGSAAGAVIMAAPLIDAATAPVAVYPVAATHQEMPLPKHPPVDPFRPLITEQGSPLAQVTVHHHRQRQPQHRNASTSPVAASVTFAAQTETAESHSQRVIPVSRVHSATRVHPTTGCAATHVVAAGESLWSIAQGAGSGAAGDWRAWYAANRATIGSNPSIIAVGERLCAPTS